MHVRYLVQRKSTKSGTGPKKNYPYATVDIKVDVEIVGFGKQMKESEMEKVRD